MHIGLQYVISSSCHITCSVCLSVLCTVCTSMSINLSDCLSATVVQSGPPIIHPSLVVCGEHFGIYAAVHHPGCYTLVVVSEVHCKTLSSTLSM